MLISNSGRIPLLHKQKARRHLSPGLLRGIFIFINTYKNPGNHACPRRLPGLSLAGEEGIEPPLTVLETAALPLYYSPRISTENDYSIGILALARDFFINIKINLELIIDMIHKIK